MAERLNLKTSRPWVLAAVAAVPEQSILYYNASGASWLSRLSVSALMLVTRFMFTGFMRTSESFTAELAWMLPTAITAACVAENRTTGLAVLGIA